MLENEEPNYKRNEFGQALAYCWIDPVMRFTIYTRAIILASMISLASNHAAVYDLATKVYDRFSTGSAARQNAGAIDLICLDPTSSYVIGMAEVSSDEDLQDICNNMANDWKKDKLENGPVH